MLQYIHDGNQGKERCLLRARNTVFWPKITYDIQELIEMHYLPRAWRVTTHHWNHSRTSTISIAHFGKDIFYWKRMGFLIVADVFSKYFLAAAICAEIATIVTELGLPHIIRSDNGPCYNSKEFQHCCNVTTSHTTLAALIILDLMVLLREWLGLLRS